MDAEHAEESFEILVIEIAFHFHRNCHSRKASAAHRTLET